MRGAAWAPLLALTLAFSTALVPRPILGERLGGRASLREVPHGTASASTGEALAVEAPYDRMADLIAARGYPLEEHFVTTVDGYILRLFRVKHGRRRPRPGGSSGSSGSGDSGGRDQGDLSDAIGGSREHGGGGEHTAPEAEVGEAVQQQEEREEAHTAADGGGGGLGGDGRRPKQRRRPVVHLQHGLLGASSDWALNGPGFSLVFLLADAGYDVWLGNVRANTYSRNHTELGPLDAAFWAFTWDDIAAKDLPAMLEHELAVTGAESLAYIGHSQGTTVGMALLSSRPEWAERIHLAVLLAPVAFATHISSPLLVALAKLNTDELFTLLGIWEFLPSSEILSRFDGQLCRIQPHMCINILAMIAGYNLDNVDAARLPIYLNYTPSGTSVANMAHWCQMVREPAADSMPFYDYGTRCKTILGAPRACNQRMYGQLAPPQYNLTAIATPVALFTGGADKLADPADVELLLGALSPEWLIERHIDDDYAHLDYLWGVNAPRRVYDRVLELLSQGPAIRWRILEQQRRRRQQQQRQQHGQQRLEQRRRR